MTARTTPWPRLWPSVLVFGVLSLHAFSKLERGHLGEMLWACHVASLLVGLGMLARQAWLVATGTLFHVGVGLPAYILDVVVLRSTTVTSVLVHVVPPLLGLRALRREQAWPRWTPLAAGALYLCLIPASRWLTAPALNVNLAFRPWAPLATLSPSPCVSWLGNLAAMAVLLPLCDRWVRRWLEPVGPLGPLGPLGAGGAGGARGPGGPAGAGGAVHG